MSNNNSQVKLLIEQLHFAGESMRGVMADVTSEVAQKLPDGTAITIAANVAHAMTGVDGIILGMLKGAAPLAMSAPTGLSAPAPNPGDWGDWGRTVQVDLDVFHEYGGKVMAAATEYLNTLTDADLDRMVGTHPGADERSAREWLTIIIFNVAWHTGEIAALKGTQGLKGYQF